MFRLNVLRRIGGLRRLIALVVSALLIVYILQTLLLNMSSTNKLNEPRKVEPLSTIKDRIMTPKQPQIEPVKEIQKTDDTKGRKVCNLEKTCQKEQLTFGLSTSLSDVNKPTACLNDLLIFDSEKLARGLNVIVLDEKQKAVQDIKYLELLSSDKEFIGFMSHVSSSRVIVVVSWGDIADKLSTDSREILQKFGSKKITEFKRGNTFLMVGQKGLKPGYAKEEVGTVTDKDIEAVVNLAGCLDFPLGPIDENVSLINHRENPPDVKNPNQLIRRDQVVYGEELAHCGLKTACPKDQVAVMFYSGKNKDDEPKVCVDGRFVIGRNLNKAGRGLNIVVLNATAKDILRVGHFDTYGEDSSTLEIFLEQMVDGEMIAVITFDEAATRLSNMAKQMFYELGSGLVQNLKFRASWFFIGQKGITGFSPFEELNFASGNDWAKAIDSRFCVPNKLDGLKTRPDPLVQTKNEAKRNFCTKYDGYEDFCDDKHIDDPLSPAPLANKSLSDMQIFKVPLLIVAGLSHNSLRLCLETVLRQPGIRPELVLVSYDENYEESGALAQLFQFKSLAVNASASYMGQFAKSLAAVWTVYPDAEAVIVLEEELMLAADFLLYLGQLLPVLMQDDTLVSASAWNDNGFKGTSHLPSVVYRVSGLAGLAFLLKRPTYTSLFSTHMSECCSQRVWEGWQFGSALDNKYSLVPDVSRVLRRHSDGLGVLKPQLENLFHRERVYTNFRDWAIWLSRPHALKADAYDKEIIFLLNSARPLPEEYLSDCAAKEATTTPAVTVRPQLPTDAANYSYAVYVHQSSPSDHSIFVQLAYCFGLYSASGQPPRGLYKGMLRFSYQERPMFVVGSTSPFFAQKPADHKAVTRL